jgi:hypothetical protein
VNLVRLASEVGCMKAVLELSVWKWKVTPETDMFEIDVMYKYSQSFRQGILGIPTCKIISI